MLATLSGAAAILLDHMHMGSRSRKGGGGGGPVEFSSKVWGWGWGVGGATTYSGQFVLQINKIFSKNRGGGGGGGGGGVPLDLNRSMHSLIAKQEAIEASIRIIVSSQFICT